MTNSVQKPGAGARRAGRVAGLSCALLTSTAFGQDCSLEVEIELPARPLVAGEAVTLAAQSTGADGPFDYAWDLDSDGIAEGQQNTISAAFPGGRAYRVSLTVTDASGCKGEATVEVAAAAPSMSLRDTAAPTEVCGDGDGVIEPGETGSVALTLTNSGETTAFDAHLLLATSRPEVQNKLSGGPDEFGYTFSDSEETSCPFEFVDISTPGAEVTFRNSFGSPTTDDGAAAIALAGDGMSLYGERVFDVAMSVNGYIAMDPEDGGDDFFTSCPLPAAPRIGPDASRLYVYHDDLLLLGNSGGGGYYEYFDLCPRASAVGDEGCHVFQWDRVSFGTGGPTGPGPRPDADFSMQALVYETSGDVVYQYTGDDPIEGRDAAVGLQNGAADIGLQYSCQAPRVRPESAVCIAAPAADLPGPLFAEGVQLLTPAPALGDLESAAEIEVALEFAVDADFECGAQLGFDVLGVSYDGGFADLGLAQQVVLTAGGENSVCDSTSACTIPPQLTPTGGLYFAEDRPGNGMDAQVVGNNLAMLWYTATPEHYPIWYFMAGGYANNQVTAPIRRFSFTGDFQPGNPSSVVVGSAAVTWTQSDHLVFWWDLEGNRWAEQWDLLRTSEDATDAEVTGQWYNPGESGWGLAINKQGEVEIQSAYLYDADGLPVWLLSDVTDEQGRSELRGFAGVHCPACPWIPAEPRAAGPLLRTFEDADNLRLDVDIVLPEPMSGTWFRENQSMQKINQ